VLSLGKLSLTNRGVQASQDAELGKVIILWQKPAAKNEKNCIY